jgi:hypothetical protein
MEAMKLWRNTLGSRGEPLGLLRTLCSFLAAPGADDNKTLPCFRLDVTGIQLISLNYLISLI